MRAALTILGLAVAGWTLALAAIAAGQWLLGILWPTLDVDWGGFATAVVILGIIAVCGWWDSHDRRNGH